MTPSRVRGTTWVSPEVLPPPDPAPNPVCHVPFTVSGSLPVPDIGKWMFFGVGGALPPAAPGQPSFWHIVGAQKYGRATTRAGSVRSHDSTVAFADGRSGRVQLGACVRRLTRVRTGLLARCHVVRSRIPIFLTRGVCGERGSKLGEVRDSASIGFLGTAWLSVAGACPVPLPGLCPHYSSRFPPYPHRSSDASHGFQSSCGEGTGWPPVENRCAQPQIRR